MSVAERAQVVAEVERQGRGRQQRLQGLDIPRSTYYRWRKHLGEPDAGRPAASRGRPWNRLCPEEEQAILASAREMPTWRSRQLAAWLTDVYSGASAESSLSPKMPRNSASRRRLISKI